MYKLIGNYDNIEAESLIDCHRELSKLVCKDCLERSNTLSDMLESGCGWEFEIWKDGGYMKLVEIDKLYEQECEDMYGYQFRR